MGVVVFDPAKFKRLYPMLDFTDEQLEQFFIEAEELCNNTEQSCIENLKSRELLLNLLVAHLAMLQQQVDAGNSAVGRISSATQGSVSVSMDYGSLGNSERWYLQTPYGAKYWQLTSKYRSALYVVTNFPMPVDRHSRTRRW